MLILNPLSDRLLFKLKWWAKELKNPWDWDR